ncbi:MAG: glycerol-3-phosphate 1-O-acyltransferase PlsY [Syntrophomonadaceae bacterium]|nr:glycerol-3-phosphate 1-O-acyltransferase PlsY [Syntrophomonadaceae bacterium]
MAKIIIVLLSYLIGSIPFSLLVPKLMAGVDIRTTGSGNVGATNVLRTLGAKGAIIALIGDVLKGFVAAWLGMMVGGTLLAAICGLVVVIGHCYSVFLKFNSGKGVATAAGVMLYLMPKIIIVLLVTFVIITFLSRYVSLASITVAALFPVMVILFNFPLEYTIMSILMAILVIYRHKENIERLRQGTESKIGQKM